MAPKAKSSPKRRPPPAPKRGSKKKPADATKTTAAAASPPAALQQQARQTARDLRKKAKAIDRLAGRDLGDSYQSHRELQAVKSQEQSAAGREIGELPAVANPARRKKCRLDLKRFLGTYFPAAFPLPWAPDHLLLIAKIQKAVLLGGLCAFALPRGFGKTTISERAAIWATLYGHHEFVVLIGATDKGAEELFESIRGELETNERLAADFPEVCYPIAKLEGIPQRRLLYKGKPIRMELTAGRIVYPDLPGSKAASAVITTASIEGRIRGMKYLRHDGQVCRPSFVLLDDPQTDETARTPAQCRKRERIINGAILGLAGPGKKISGIMPCTVIQEGDLADSFLDHKKHPEWSGERHKLVKSLPGSTRWDGEYAEIYREGLRLQDGNAAANAYYVTHREEMDAGGEVAWVHLHRPDELSAIQHAMNLKLRNERAFFAEAQNAPLPEEEADTRALSAEAVAQKLNRVPRGTVPVNTQVVTMGTDVQGELLYWVVTAWGDQFSGSVVDYGTWPRQPRDYFTLRDAPVKLSDKFKSDGLSAEARIYAALRELVKENLAREWKKDNGHGLRVQRALIDANWGDNTTLVYQFCRESEHAAVLTPSHGRGIGASSNPMSSLKVKTDQGEQLGLNWIIRSPERGIRGVTYDTNFWKSFVGKRLLAGMGDKSSLNLFGESPIAHRLFADQMTAEYFVTAEARGRRVDEWKKRPNEDNHYFDALVMSAVAASMAGVKLKEAGDPPPPRERRIVSFAEMQKAAGVRR